MVRGSILAGACLALAACGGGSVTLTAAKACFERAGYKAEEVEITPGGEDDRGGATGLLALTAKGEPLPGGFIEFFESEDQAGAWTDANRARDTFDGQQTFGKVSAGYNPKEFEAATIEGCLT